MDDVDDDVAGLQKGMASERLGMEADPLGKTMAAMFPRDELELPPREADGFYPIH
ncbi:hypothetical protein [Shinella daejeonensis]|uniref:hypothetical protein n=1 Tax=Shinella daejeonensis TaxID=659017 RepID=UPI0020C80A7A|nr:hypothetical protein [Shinella daejeonensis]